MNLAVKINFKNEVLATPYRKSNSLEAVVEQNNCTNSTLKIGDQLNRMPPRRLPCHYPMSDRSMAVHFQTSSVVGVLVPWRHYDLLHCLFDSTWPHV